MTINELKTISLPKVERRYSPLPNEMIIDKIQELCIKNNMTISKEYAITTKNKDRVMAYHNITSNTDTELQKRILWNNSYDKSLSFKIAMGANVKICENGMVTGDVLSYKRRHIGSITQDAMEMIEEGLTLLDEAFTTAVQTKEDLKTIYMPYNEMSKYAGELLYNKVLLPNQMLRVIDEISKPSFQYSEDEETAWTFYNHCTLALKESHPNDYILRHNNLHTYFSNEFL